jgi:hypothetical protein
VGHLKSHVDCVNLRKLDPHNAQLGGIHATQIDTISVALLFDFRYMNGHSLIGDTCARVLAITQRRYACYSALLLFSSVPSP